MSYLSSTVVSSPATGWRQRTAWCLRLMLASLTLAFLSGCVDRAPSTGPGAQDDLFPPAPATPRAAALGNLKIGPHTSEFNRSLSMLLLGTSEPEPSLGLLKPTTITVRNDELLICDPVLGGIVSWNPQRSSLAATDLHPRPQRPVAAQAADGGGLLVVDAGAGLVERFDATGKRIRSYGTPGPIFKPAFALQVENQIWVSNVGAATVERFDAADGHALEPLHGVETPALPFVMPYGLARTPNGDVLVVDMLAPTVHVFTAAGKWLRRFGSAGDRPGFFARPKYAAVAPDGTIFISDAGLQRIHVFDAQGRPLLALGESRQADWRLTVPAGLAIGSTDFLKNETIPAGFHSNFAVLTAEQITNPGVRGYAWGIGERPGNVDLLKVSPTNSRGTVNPHWTSAGCKTCHGEDQPHAIDVASTQVLCLSCHDGLKASQEFHPIARVASGGPIQTPPDWPILEGRLTCLTCHEISRHCRENDARPVDNPEMLRRFDPLQPFAICTSCHADTPNARINPHRRTGDAARDAQMCNFCHLPGLKESPTGQRTGQAALRVENSSLCLTCHSKHWDYFTPGHVERQLPPQIQANLAREALADGTLVKHGGVQHASDILPTVNGKVVCYSCHNPHTPESYPLNTPLGLRSQAPRDQRVNFRLERAQLCFTCHNK